MTGQFKKNQIYTVTVTDMNDMGHGVARIEGAVVFVAGGVTDDVCEARIIKVASSYLVARIERLITPSPRRAEPSCPVSKRCGGCAFDAVDRAYELELKRGFVLSAFKKQGMEPECGPVLTDGRAYGYRNKVAYPVEGAKMGYYAPHSHEMIDRGGECPLASGLIDPVARHIANEIKASPVASLRHVCIRAGEGTGEVGVCFVSRDADAAPYRALADRLCGRFPEISSVTQNVNPADTNVILGKEYITLAGREYVEDELCGLRFRVSPASFWQVNRGAAELLYRAAAEKAGLRPGEKLLDLYCGAGSVGLSMAAGLPGVKLTGVEIVPEAVENAKINAAANGFDDAEFICADAGEIAVGDYDVIVVDPPRKGLAPDLVDRVAASGNRRLVYVSCNPATLARDCARFIERGYTMGELTPVDMFPRTGHVETVVLMTRTQLEATD